MLQQAQTICPIDPLDNLLHKNNFDIDKIMSVSKEYNIDTIKNRIDVIQGYKEKLVNILKIPKIEQKSPEWYEARHKIISASDFAQALGEGKFGTQRDLIIKKVDPPEYGTLNNPFFEWGNMFEQVASDIYAKMHNVEIHEFGLLRHPHISYAGASPDGISENGIMLEIKCPLKRKITPGADVPTQYYYQIQGQLDVCDLDECDYFECEFTLCKSVWEFEASNNTRGIFAKKNNEYIYGPLTLSDANDKTRVKDIKDIEKFAEDHADSSLHYWILKIYNLKRVLRDKAFIDKVLTELGDVWKQILHYRENREAFVKDILKIITIETEVYEKEQREQQVNIKAYAFLD